MGLWNCENQLKCLTHTHAGTHLHKHTRDSQTPHRGLSRTGTQNLLPVGWPCSSAAGDSQRGCVVWLTRWCTLLWVLSVYSGNGDVKTLRLACKHLIKLRKKNKWHAYLKTSSCWQLSLSPKQYSSLNIDSESDNRYQTFHVRVIWISKRRKNFFLKKSDNNKVSEA